MNTIGSTGVFSSIIEDINENFSAISQGIGLIGNRNGLLPIFNSAAKTLTIQGRSILYYKGLAKHILGDNLSSLTDKTISLAAYPDGFITYKISDSTFTVRNYSELSWPDDEILICTYSDYGVSYVMPGLTLRIPSGALGLIYNANTYCNFDSTQKTFTIPGASRFMYQNTYSLILGTGDSPTAAKVIDLSSIQTGRIYFNPKTYDWTVFSHSSGSPTENDVLIATYGGYGAYANMASTFTINNEIPVLPTEEVISPNYTETDISSLDSGNISWSDFVVINSELWMFKPSSDETHTATDGKIYRINMSTWAITATITHNFGHCNTVHYDADSDVLMIGNLPGNGTYPAALYLMYDFSTLSGESSLDFDTVDKTIIDLADVNVDLATSAIGVFGETNRGVRNIVYVSGDFNRSWAKLLLGMGSNDLGSGTYSSNDSDKYNGSFEIISEGYYSTVNNDGSNVTQGVDYYAGKIYTSNGSLGYDIRGGIWNLNRNNRPLRKLIHCEVYDSSGDLVDIENEGLIIHNDKVLHGIYNNTLGIKSIIEYDIPS